MKSFVSMLSFLLLSLVIAEFARADKPTTEPSTGLRISDRTVTDPLVKVTGNVNTSAVLAKVDPQAITVTRGDLVVTPHLWGQDDVFSVHPQSEKVPTLVDFSAITKSTKGTLRFWFHDALTGHPAAVIKVDGKQTQRIAVNGNDWKEAKVLFDHNAVVLEATATGWWNEHVVTTYSIDTGADSVAGSQSSNPRNPAPDHTAGVMPPPKIFSESEMKQEVELLHSDKSKPAPAKAEALRQQLLSGETYQKVSEIDVAGGVQNLCLSGAGDVIIWQQGSKIIKWSATQPSVVNDLPITSAHSRAMKTRTGRGFLLPKNDPQPTAKPESKESNATPVDWTPQVINLRRDGQFAIALAKGGLHWISLKDGTSGDASLAGLMCDPEQHEMVKPTMSGGPSPWLTLSPSGRFAAWGPATIKGYQSKPEFPYIVTDTVTKRSLVMHRGQVPLVFVHLSDTGMPVATSDAGGLYSYADGGSFQLPPSPVREIGRSWLLRPNGHVDFMRQTTPGADGNPKSIETGKGTIVLVKTPAEGVRVLLLKHDVGGAAAEIWDFQSAKKLLTVSDPKITDCAISADGATVAIAIANGPKSKIQRWSLEPWRIDGASECMAIMGEWKPVGKTTGSGDTSATQDIACAWFNSQYDLKTGESAAMERQAFGTNADVRLNRGNSDDTNPPKDGSGTDAQSDNSRDQGDKSTAAKSGDTNTQQQGSKSGELLHAASYRVTYTCDSCGYIWTTIHSLPYSGEQGVVCPKCNKQGAKASSEKMDN